MIIKQIFNHFNNKYDFKNQCNWDSSGIQFRTNLNKKINNILICLDINLENVNYAIKNKCNLIISHHPLVIDQEIKRKKYFQNIIKISKNNNITLLSLHTNFDNSIIGMNYKIAEKLGFTNIKKAFKNSIGIIGEYQFNLNTLISKIKKELNIDYLITNNKIQDLNNRNYYLCAGAGSSEIEHIILNNKKNDLPIFFSGEIKWNLWNLANDNNITIFDIGHIIEQEFINIISDDLISFGIKKNKIYTFFPKKNTIL